MTETRSRSSLRRALPWIGLLVLFLVTVGVVLTINWFLNPRVEDVTTVQPADAVVMFAGSDERLETALQLAERGTAPNLVIPNGADIEDAEDLCEQSAGFRVFCPATNPISTQGEAQAIGRLAGEQGWSSLIAVTSEYHVHRATYLLGRCHSGPIQAVAATRDMGPVEWVDKLVHEWAGFLAAVVFPPAC